MIEATIARSDGFHYIEDITSQFCITYKLNTHRTFIISGNMKYLNMKQMIYISKEKLYENPVLLTVYSKIDNGINGFSIIHNKCPLVNRDAIINMIYVDTQ